MQKKERVIIMAPVGQDAVAIASLLDAQGFETQICNGSDEYSRQITDRAGALFWTPLKRNRPGPSYRLSFSQAAANRAGQDYSIWPLQLPDP